MFVKELLMHIVACSAAGSTEKGFKAHVFAWPPLPIPVNHGARIALPVALPFSSWKGIVS